MQKRENKNFLYVVMGLLVLAIIFTSLNPQPTGMQGFDPVKWCTRASQTIVINYEGSCEFVYTPASHLPAVVGTTIQDQIDECIKDAITACKEDFQLKLSTDFWPKCFELCDKKDSAVVDCLPSYNPSGDNCDDAKTVGDNLESSAPDINGTTDTVGRFLMGLGFLSKQLTITATSKGTSSIECKCIAAMLDYD